MRIALGIEYDGSAFYGWQTQRNLRTVQEDLENAISEIANHRVQIFCAGRTDAGVHATGQVIHFDTEAERPLRAWREGVNTHLASAISVKWSVVVDDEFHARFSATARRYRYVIYNHSSRPAILYNKVTWYFRKLDVGKMHQAAQSLLGECDFTAFRSSQCESNTPMRNIHEIHVSRHGDFVIIEVEANAFLHHMVRNIVGVLLPVGIGARPPEWVGTVLAAKDRRLAGETADAAGLYLYRVKYPEKYAFPDPQNSILFL